MNNPLYQASSLCRLSRIGATSTMGDIRLEVDLKRPQNGMGICLHTNSDGTDLALWVSEHEWCTWLAPQLHAPSLDQIEESLHPLLACWTLSPLDSWLQAQGLPPLTPATLAPGPAPKLCWRLIMEQESRRLSIYLEKVPAALLQRWLSAFTPNPARRHDFNLLLGWCQLNEAQLSKATLGEALPLHGMGEAPDHFWLSPLRYAAKVQLLSVDSGVVIPTSPLPLPPAGTVRLMVEAGGLSLDAATLAQWSPGLEFTTQAYAHAGLRLLRGDQPWAEGTLLRLDNGWAIRLTTQPTHRA